MDSAPVRRRLHGFTLEEHDTLTSTQEELRRRLATGEDVSGLVLRAREQVGGRGRRGTPWASPRGGSYQSLALKISDLGPSARVDSRLTLALGIGIAQALNEAGAQVLLKWPNDLILGGRKLGGIIAEAASGSVIVGVGINVRNAVPDGAAALDGWEPPTVGDLVLAGVRGGLGLLREPAESFVSGYRALDWLRGREVVLTAAVLSPTAGPPLLPPGSKRFTGVARGVAGDGSLRLELAGGGEVNVVAGHLEAVGRGPAE